MRKMPLLPRPWLSPLTSLGAAHSMCNWQSPNLSLVRISPVAGATCITPSLISHLAGLPSFADSHFDKSDPSNSTTASDGGWPGCSGELNVPGVTTLGCGRLGSCTAQG